jgi:hypothetical protein
MMMRAEPEAVNFSSVFNGFDTQSKLYPILIIILVLVNDLEEIFETQKFNSLTDFIDLDKMMT